MSRVEYKAMAAEGRVQPDLYGKDLKHATLPPDAGAYRAAETGSVFVEFDVSDAQIAPGGRDGWAIIFGPNSPRGILEARRGRPLGGMPAAGNITVILAPEAIE